MTPPGTTTDRRARRVEEAARRRSERRRRAERAQRRARYRRVILRWTGKTLIGLVLIAAVGSVIGLTVHLVRNALKPGPGHLPPMTAIHAYRIDYRTIFSGNTVNDEQRVVERPFHSLELTRRGGQIVTGTISNDQGLWFYDDSKKGWNLINPSRQLPENDPRPAPALARALTTGLGNVRGTKTIAGRNCTLVRTGAPIGEPLKKASHNNRVDLCLDRTGVLLDYRWTLNGKMAQTMTALSFDDHPVLAPDTFTPQAVPNAPPPPIQSAPLSDSGRAQLTPHVDAPPGFTYVSGTVAVRSLGSSPQSSSDLLYLHGVDDLVVVTYSQGSTSHPGATP
ncbi:MAG TPA: hypothetical protein VF942_01395, partial [Acidimicrobiales bacterium]